MVDEIIFIKPTQVTSSYWL